MNYFIQKEVIANMAKKKIVKKKAGKKKKR